MRRVAAPRCSCSCCVLPLGGRAARRSPPTRWRSRRSWPSRTSPTPTAPTRSRSSPRRRSRSCSRCATRATTPVTVRYVRLEGKALGLTFLTYDLGVRTTLAPGEQTTLDTTLDFFDLESQATGYLGTSLRVYDPDATAPRLGGLRRRRAGQRHLDPRPVRVRGPRRGHLLHDRARAEHAAPPPAVEPVRARHCSSRSPARAIGVTLALGLAILRITFADVEAWVPAGVRARRSSPSSSATSRQGRCLASIRDVREEEALQVVGPDRGGARLGHLRPRHVRRLQPRGSASSASARLRTSSTLSGEHVAVEPRRRASDAARRRRGE